MGLRNTGQEVLLSSAVAAPEIWTPEEFQDLKETAEVLGVDEKNHRDPVRLGATSAGELEQGKAVESERPHVPPSPSLQPRGLCSPLFHAHKLIGGRVFCHSNKFKPSGLRS